MPTNIALLGAGGKMGCRIADNLRSLDRYEVLHVEIAPAGIRNLADRGIAVTPQAEALARAEVVVLALPDKILGPVTEEVAPLLRPSTMLITLDPAAAYAGLLAIRDDVTFFVTHPCHPPLFNADTEPDKMNDWFGGVHASQHIVCALHRGPESDYSRGEAIGRDMYGNRECPVLDAHRVTVEQMAMLEPALVETTAATLLYAIKEIGEEAVSQGVPREAMEAFLQGHLRTILAIVFGHAGFPMSDGALLAVEKAKDRIFQPDWKSNIMSERSIRRSVAEITGQRT